MATILHPSRLRAAEPVMSVAEIITSLRSCTTETDYREWLSATAASRAILPQDALQIVEKARRGVEHRTHGIERECRLLPEPEPISIHPRQYLAPQAGTGLLHEVRTAMARHQVAPSTIGRAALGDPGVIRDMERGRTPRSSTAEKLRTFIAGLQQMEVRA